MQNTEIGHEQANYIPVTVGKIWDERHVQYLVVLGATGTNAKSNVRKGVVIIQETDRGLLFLANHNNIVCFREEKFRVLKCQTLATF
jgi:hypothetical protein